MRMTPIVFAVTFMAILSVGVGVNVFEIKINFTPENHFIAF